MRSSFGPRAAGAALAATTLIVLALPGVASAAMSCSFDGGTGLLTVTHSDVDSPTITFRTAHDGPDLVTQVLDGAIEVTPDCRQPVSSVSQMALAISGGDPMLVIDGANSFQPSRAPASAPDVSEVKFTTSSSGGGTLSSVLLTDDDGRGDVYRLKLDGVDTDDDGDVDVVSDAAGENGLEILGGLASDLIDGSGGPTSPGSWAYAPLLDGSLGNDLVIGTDGPDVLEGGKGDDVVEGRAGADDLYGGPGIDIVSYEHAAGPISLSLANSVEQQTGGAGQDSLPDADFEGVLGSSFKDFLRGSEGADHIDGGPAEDQIVAEGGADTVQARDGASDDVSCGAGFDTGVFDLTGVDAVADCENAIFAQPPVTTPPPGQDTSVTLALGGVARQLLGKRGLAVTVRCPDEACTVDVGGAVKAPSERRGRQHVRKRTLTAKPVKRALKARATYHLRVRFNATQRARITRALKHGKKLSATIGASARDRAGNRRTRKLKVALKPPAIKKHRRPRH